MYRDLALDPIVSRAIQHAVTCLHAIRVRLELTWSIFLPTRGYTHDIPPPNTTGGQQLCITHHYRLLSKILWDFLHRGFRMSQWISDNSRFGQLFKRLNTSGCWSPFAGRRPTIEFDEGYWSWWVSECIVVDCWRSLGFVDEGYACGAFGTNSDVSSQYYSKIWLLITTFTKKISMCMTNVVSGQWIHDLISRLPHILLNCQPLWLTAEDQCTYEWPEWSSFDDRRDDT